MLRVGVIGGGAAGGAAATLLARRGHEVCVFEARAFPRVKVCGEFVSPAAAGLLTSLVGEPSLRAAGARREGRMVLEVGARAFESRLRTPGWALSRSSLDVLLLEGAARAGAGVEQPALVRAVRYDGAGAEVDVEARGEGVTTRRFDVVLHADGSGRLDPRGAVAHARGVVGMKCHLRLPSGAGDGLGGVRIRAGRGGYVGLMRVEHGLWTCAMVVRTGLARAHAGDGDRVLRGLWAGYEPCWRATDWLACPVARSGFVPGGHERSLRLGNAAGAVDPVGGEGIGLALWSAGVLAGLIGAGPGSGGSEAGWWSGVHAGYARAYRARLRTRRWACRAAAEVLMRPWAVGLLSPMLAAPGLTLGAWGALSGKRAGVA